MKKLIVGKVFGNMANRMEKRSGLWTRVSLMTAAALLILLTGSAAQAADTIGVINSQEIVRSHPKFEEVTKQLQQIGRQKESEAREAAEKETDPSKKAQVVQAKRVELSKEEERLMTPIFKDCEAAVRVVAKNKKVTIVLEKASVYFGGLDITLDVVQQIKR
ncbi:MAG: OmpH family outer membrane protein [Synergistaceae bacterium]|jgi:outer membrane protein|nr:OmpH family outer membrane protein [Synergistaceae bacterium]